MLYIHCGSIGWNVGAKAGLESEHQLLSLDRVHRFDEPRHTIRSLVTGTSCGQRCAGIP